MPRSIELINTRRAAQLKALAQIRGTLPAIDRRMVAELYEASGFDNARLQDWQLDMIEALAARFLSEVAP